SPTPAKQPVKPAPPTPARQSFDWNSLQQTIAKAARTAPPRPSSAPRGPTRAETDLNARVDAGQGVSQSELEGLQQLLGRLWNPNCSAEGGADVKLKVSYWVGTDGRVRGAVSAGGAENSSDPVVYAAAHRAISAVHQVEPYAAQFQGQKITVNFNAKDVCANR
ncbi:MAG TPA: energy transducer TonB, partial [Caulobacteraceae bacterium]|nr:energy transducer TonB [Caulobacteraceae bacterium]